MSNHDPYSDSEPWLCYAMSELCGELLKFERLLLPASIYEMRVITHRLPKM